MQFVIPACAWRHADRRIIRVGKKLIKICHRGTETQRY